MLTDSSIAFSVIVETPSPLHACMRAQRLTYVTYLHAINAGQVPIHIPIDAARRHAYCTPPGMSKRCVCAVFRSGSLSGNARAAMPRRGGRSQPAPGPHSPRPLYPRLACQCLRTAGFIFLSLFTRGQGAELELFCVLLLHRLQHGLCAA